MKRTKDDSLVVEFERLTYHRPVEAALDRGKRQRADRAHGSALGRRGKADEDGAEHQEDQHERRNESDDHADCELNAVDRAELLGQGRRGLRIEDRHEHHIAEIEAREHEAGNDGALVHVANRTAELVGHDDQDEARRNDLGERAGGGDHAGREPPIVAVAQHDRQRDQPHGDNRGGDDAGGRREQRADDDHCEGEAAAHRPEELSDRVEQLLRHSGALQNEAHEGEEGYGEQRVVAHHTENAIRQDLEEGRLEEPEPHADNAPAQPDESK